MADEDLSYSKDGVDYKSLDYLTARALANGKITQALIDIRVKSKRTEDKLAREAAIRFLTQPNKLFTKICDILGTEECYNRSKYRAWLDKQGIHYDR